MKRMLWVAAALAAGSLQASEPAGKSDGALLLFGTGRDHYDTGFGAAWQQDITPGLSCIVGVERVSVEDESSYADAWSNSRTTMEADGYEVQLGYLHHLRRDADGFSLSLGPVIGLEELEGEQRTTYTGMYGGTDRTDIDYDLGVNVYLQGLIRYGGFEKVDLFSSVAFGYRSGREARYSTGGGVVPLAEGASDLSRSGVPYYGDDYRVILGSDTFIRVALGVAIPF